MPLGVLGLATTGESFGESSAEVKGDELPSCERDRSLCSLSTGVDPKRAVLGFPSSAAGSPSDGSRTGGGPDEDRLRAT